MNALPYFLNASLYLLLFYGCYALLLRRNTFFGLNRTYLLTSIGLSLVLPLVELPGGATDALTGNTISLPAFTVGRGTESARDELSTDQWFWLVYGLGLVGMLLRLALNGWGVRRLIRGGVAESRCHYTLVRLATDNVPSFSFGRYLVLNRTDALTEPDALIRHEEAHIQQRHTLDILFTELVRAALWFNPLLILYKRSLQEVHEFLADAAVARTAPRPDYARQLVAYALNVPSAMLTTPFVSTSTLKQRIVMLQKPASNRRALLGYALVLPLAGLLTLCTQPDRDLAQPDQSVTTNQPARQASVEGPIFTVVEENPEFKGGMKALGAYISANLTYPKAAQKVNAEGRVFVRFIVTKDGDVTDVKLLRGIGFGTGEEAVRVVAGMPRWKPGRQSGRAVNVQYNLPINFQLEDNETPGSGTNKTSFFSPPTNDADIQKMYKHFVVDGKEVSFDAFRKHDKAAITEASSSQQTIRIQTMSPPPPPPVPANDASALSDIKYFTINGKEATEAAVTAIPPKQIVRVDVNKEQGTVTVTTK
ncbi:M56 family metallopeptidase [Spirosoma utsteinense]|uniref:TonB family protein n=1 Tax=Spirosoma utsteinense TaxID=2585773 RepID=A0ABR6W4W1_9BACT|nr:M56 family metallopeptidase [Spirosoma utsteinense]MBC3784240.1 TonB family protein [Spirosoma utsteinense]MBC3790962.1 TonB family protein [Spirosoma utsteinense]